MPHSKDQLWPFKRSFAYLAIPVIWIFFVLIFVAGLEFNAWENRLPGTVVIVISIISFIPVLLVLLDFFSLKGATLDIKGVKIDFSKVAADASTGNPVAVQLPDNIGRPGAVVTDSVAMSIMGVLHTGANHKIVVINLKSGDAWWVTRLLVLCAGAVRIGSPKTLVFLGKKENKIDQFLGLGKPDDLLNAMLIEPKYRERYEKAIGFAKQFLLYKDLAGFTPTLAIPPPDILRYTQTKDYMDLKEEATEHIILDQLGNFYFDINKPGSLEDPPDKLTISRLNQLFEHCLYKDAINLNSKSEEQIKQLLNSSAPYLALVKDGQYVSTLKKTEGESFVLKELALSTGNSNK